MRSALVRLKPRMDALNKNAFEECSHDIDRCENPPVEAFHWEDGGRFRKEVEDCEVYWILFFFFSFFVLFLLFGFCAPNMYYYFRKNRLILG